MLAGHVVDRYLQNQRIPGIVRHIFLQIIPFREIPGPDQSQDPVLLLIIRHFRDAPEADDADKTVPPLAGIPDGL